VLVLVAASDAAVRAAVAAAVRGAGYAVLEAADGAAAWRAFAARRPPLLVVDLGLAPGGGADAADAWSLCARVAAERPAEPVDDDAGRDAGHDAGRDAGHDAGRDAGHDARDGGHDAGHDAGADEAPDPFVLVTVPRDGAADLQRALDAGADDYFTTPPSPRNVAARLSIAERRMRQAAARRRTERALRRARWLAGIGETSIALQHEINNPLAALLGHAALLEEGLVAPGEEGEALQVVVEQAHRIASVMKRLAALRDPRSVEYFGGARMIDLSRAGAGPAAPAEQSGGAGDGARGRAGGRGGGRAGDGAGD
jgi:DNA-binding response OmpR family regulator